jgi:hydroxymethylbilane synthase
MLIKIGTRGSKLAMWQAEMVASKLQQQGAEIEIVKIETKGDQILNQSLSEIGSKGLFTAEIEEQLINGSIDIAVHSAKDLQSSLPAEMELIAFTERETPNDVLVSFKTDVNLSHQNLIVGTSSARRRATLKHFYPHIQLVEMRGNLQTRFQKMQNGHCDAMILAYAGVHRMQLDEHIVAHLPMDTFVPPVGQGCVAIESHINLSTDKKNIVKNALNHVQTEICVRAEREVLAMLEGGCSVPLFCIATLQDANLHITAGIIDVEGKQRIVEQMVLGSSELNVGLKQLVSSLEAKGIRTILEKVKPKQY